MKMRARMWMAMVASIACVLAIALLIPSAPATAKTLKIQSTFPHGDLSMDLLKEFAAAVEKNSNGKLKVKVFADPEIVPMEQLFGATKRGVLDMLQGAGIIWQGIMPAANVEFGLPLAYKIRGETDFEKQANIVRDFLFKEGAVEVLREEYAKHGLYLLDFHTYGPVPFVLSTTPLRTLSDMKGKKIRTDGINHAYHAGAGMQGASISGLETYMALKLGTVDAAEWDVSAVTGLKWHEVAPYWIRGADNDQCIGHILVNLKKWKKLSPEMKTALEKGGEAYWHATVKGYKKEMDTVRELIDTGKLTEIFIDKEAENAYTRVAYKIWDDTARDDETSAKLVQLFKKWHGVK